MPPGPLPLLVRPRMVSAVRAWLRAEGPSALWRQPASGVPFKVFAREAGALRVPLGPFLVWAVGARSLRFALAACVAALVGSHAPVCVRSHPCLLLAGWSLAFGVALWRTVAAWSGPDDV